MKKYILYGIVLLSALGSCRKEIKSKQGGIDLISNIYINASKNLEDTQSFHISRLNYSNDTIIELVPNVANPLITDEIHFIKDSLFYSLGNPVNAGISTITEVVATEKPTLVYSENKRGAIFSKNKVPNYHQKRDLKDTILFGKTYKRFEINSPQSYSFPELRISPFSSERDKVILDMIFKAKEVPKYAEILNQSNKIAEQEKLYSPLYFDKEKSSSPSETESNELEKSRGFRR